MTALTRNYKEALHLSNFVLVQFKLSSLGVFE